MKIIDILFALICGRVMAWLAYDFLKGYGLDVGFWKWFLAILLPIISLICLWLAHLIGKKIPFVFQVAKFVLVGALATVVDLELFQFSIWVFSLATLTTAVPVLSSTSVLITSKVASFLLATGAKYWGNKYWAFEKSDKENWKKELVKFFAVTVVGLIADVLFFFYFSKILGPQFGTPPEVWLKLSVILAAIAAASWNFFGYKFIVFKK
ncbi:MAG: GtrA family protein [bacterium]|nr:GtrA family protein [bacterium]